jgi:hypothetical protein
LPKDECENPETLQPEGRNGIKILKSLMME